MTNIRFKANPQKILEGLVWIAGQRPGKGFHFILKTMFYADKWHLQRFGRPVFGDVYVKMPFGPVASVAYDLLKQSDYAPADLLHEMDAALSVERDGSAPAVRAKREAKLSLFSQTDTDCLNQALEKCDGKSFNKISDATHEEPAWLEAEMNRQMDYEKFIDADTPDREALIEYICETAHCVAV